MEIYLNPSNIDFYNAVSHSQIYVDKTNLIKYTNKVLFGEQKFICVSRPRRFGKSMTANMLTAYYSRGCDSKEMLENLKISKADSFEKHLNKYNVIRINMMDFFSEYDDTKEMLTNLQKEIMYEIIEEFPDVRYYDETKLMRSLKDVFAKYQVPFIFIIDEWDCFER